MVILKEMRPYLFIKSEQVDLGIDFQTWMNARRTKRMAGKRPCRGAPPLPPEDLSQRLVFAERMKELKRVC